MQVVDAIVITIIKYLQTSNVYNVMHFHFIPITAIALRVDLMNITVG